MRGLFRKKQRVFAGSPDKRLYAIGDVHGCIDKLQALVQKIEDDNDRRDKKQVSIVLLGDLIDRGDNSKAVVEFWMKAVIEGASKLHLIGNHEDMMFNVWDGADHLLDTWLENGGDKTLQSYGLDMPKIAGYAPSNKLASIRKHIPKAHIDFLKSGYDRIQFGDYCLVHAGIDPRLPLEDQDAAQFHWIREPFLSWKKPLQFKVIHGHTITAEVDFHHHRIGVDTGAYQGGPLSAVRIEGTETEVLSVKSLKNEVGR